MLGQTTEEIQDQYLVSQQVSSDRVFVYCCPGYSDGSAVQQYNTHIHWSLQWNWKTKTDNGMMFEKEHKVKILPVKEKGIAEKLIIFYHLLLSSQYKGLAQVTVLHRWQRELSSQKQKSCQCHWRWMVVRLHRWCSSWAHCPPLASTAPGTWSQVHWSYVCQFPAVTQTAAHETQTLF